MTEDELLSKENHRQLFIQAAVALAEEKLKEYESATDDEKSYMWYKVGASMLMKGVQAIDKRVLMTDMGALTTVQVTPVKEPKPEVDLGTCDCGRPIILDDGCLDEEQEKVCLGCLDYPFNCKCKKLSKTQV